MNKLKLMVGLILLTAAMSITWVGLTSAHSFRTGTNVTAGQDQVVNETIFAAGRTIDINSEVFGDIFCAGQTVTISGTVHGDVICAGQTVNITGKVDGDIRLAGQTVTVGAAVAGNATVAGQSFNLESTGKIDGDITIGSSDSTVNGPVGRDLAAGGDNLIISSTIGRNVKATVNNLVLTSSADVKGSIDYTSSNTLVKENGAEVSGEVNRTEPTRPAATKRGAVFGFTVAWFIYWFLAMLVTAMAIALLFPKALHAVSEKAMPKPWKALLTGFLASIAMPFVLLILAITIVGLPLAFLVGLMWLVVLILSGPFSGYYLGRIILRDSTQPLLIMLVGATILLVLYFVPIVGFLALLAAAWIGSGMLLLEAFDRTPKPAYSLSSNNSKKK